MTTTRREKIEAMLKDDPNDVFLRYSLGMEMSSEGEIDEALTMFGQLASEQPPHVPAFFRSAQILADAGKIEQSRAQLREGIDAARQQGDAHAAAEMSEMLEDLGSYGT